MRIDFLYIEVSLYESQIYFGKFRRCSGRFLHIPGNFPYIPDKFFINPNLFQVIPKIDRIIKSTVPTHLHYKKPA